MIIKVPRTPSPGETILGVEFSMVQGGKGANQAVAAARAGGKVSFIACVGNDQFGRDAMKSLASEGIDISCVKIHNIKPSGIALINVAEDGTNSISVAPGANSQLHPEDILKVQDVIKNSDIVLMQMEIPVETIKAVTKITRKSNSLVILNPAPASHLDSDIIENIDVLTPNENEAALIAETDPAEADFVSLGKKLHGMGLKTIIITLGANGAFYSCDGSCNHIKTDKVNAIDTTAAGDVFNGYLCVSLALGKNIEEAVRVANKAASISVTRFGAQPSIPFAEEVII